MPCAWVFISNRGPDEGTMGSDEDHCAVGSEETRL